MIGTATLQTADTGSPPAGSIQQLHQQTQATSAAAMNSFRIAAVADRLAINIEGGIRNTTEFFNLCLSLARGIDYAVANNELPGPAKDRLPPLLKKVCQHAPNVQQQTGIMVLMVSVKNACVAEWFLKEESEELLALANEIASIFCSSGDLNSPVNYSIISKIMARFYPLMSMGKILTSFEVKHGYHTCVQDFHISKSTAHTRQEKIRLFVAQTDCIETSACITSPQQVNFLLNGKTVDRRTNVLMDNGPQMPTNISSLLKYGTNLLQAVGHFNGSYIILVAFMSVKSPTAPTIPDYVRHDVATQDLDSDIIEGPSRISLNCPISHTRIKTPVKGHSCKHLQCFDFDNYVDINLRRPSWKCPHCIHPVCYTDIRLDQNMVKVLQEVGNSVANIIISADGSWKAVLETDNSIDETLDETTLNHQNEAIDSPCNNPFVLDLTGDDDIMNELIWSEDRKPVINESSMPSVIVSHTDAPPVDDEFFSDICFPGESIGVDANLVSSSLATDSISPARSQQAEDINNISFVQVMQRIVHENHHGSYRPPTGRPQNVINVPIAIQALAAQPPQQRPRLSPSPLVPNGSSVTPSPSFSPVSLNPVSSQQLHPTVQNRSHPYGQVPGAHIQNSRPQQLHRMMGQSPPVMVSRPSYPLVRTSMAGNGQPSRYTYAPRQPMPCQISRTSTAGEQQRVNVRGPVVDLAAGDQSWRPAGRMRGSLSGRSYSAALSDLIIQPTQSSQQRTPPASASIASQSTATTVPTLEALLANTRAANANANHNSQR